MTTEKIIDSLYECMQKGMKVIEKDPPESAAICIIILTMGIGLAEIMQNIERKINES